MKYSKNQHYFKPKQQQQPQQENANNICFHQNNYKVVSNHAILSLVDKLVKIRCTNDATDENKARHCCAIFMEKNQSCFKPGCQRYQPRKLYYETEKYKRRRKI